MRQRVYSSVHGATCCLTTTLRRISTAVALAAISTVVPVLLAPTASEAAGPIVVNTLTDESTPGDGLCSLREAINNANAKSDTTGGDCAPGTGNDTINFSMSGTITLAGGGLPAIQNTLTIDGVGQSITVDGANSFRVLSVNLGATLGLNALTIAHGNAGGGAAVDNAGTLAVANSSFSNNISSASGGAISNELNATLTVTSSTFSGNTAPQGGAIFNSTGTLTVTNSAFSGNSASVYEGGAIFSEGTLTVTSGTFTGNSAPGSDAGAIFNDAALTVTNSTFSSNSAGSAAVNGWGGAIYNLGPLTVGGSTFSGNSTLNSGGSGGAIVSFGSSVSVTNSTFFGNSAGGQGSGGAVATDTTTSNIANDTFSGNGASLGGALAGSVRLASSILVNSTGGNCANSATIFSNGGNIADDSSCGFGTSTGANGQTIGDNVNPLLDPNGLQNNGGPTQTIALQPTSPAIDAVAIASCPSTDQRGMPRPDPEDIGSANPACDIGAFELQPSGWPMFRHDVRHTGLSQFDTSANIGVPQWTFATGSAVASSPALGPDGTIYVGANANDDSLHALNRNGSLKWKFTTGFAVESSPAVAADGTIYFGSDDDNFYALDSGGNLKWKFGTGGPVRTSPSVATDGTIYFGSDDDNLYAINPDGSPKWKFTTGLGVESSPAIGTDGTVYFGSDDGNLYALNPDGSLKWDFTTANPDLRSSPSVAADGTIYVGGEDDHLYALNPDGSLKWKLFTGKNIQSSSPAISADGTVYVGSQDDNLYAVNPNGSLKWMFLTNGLAGVSSPAIGADGAIYIGTILTDGSGGSVYAVNPDGSLKWTFNSGEVFSSPAIGADGSVYVGGGNNLYALGRFNTPAGTNITVPLGVPPSSTVSSVTAQFSNVSTAGQTSVSTSSAGPTIPANFQFGSQPIYFDVSTTATFSGLITICFDYNPASYSDPSSLSLLHYQGGAWANVTPLSNNTAQGVLCGQVTSLSPFVIARPAATPPPAPGGGIGGFGGFGGFPTPQPTPPAASGSQITVSPQRLGFGMTPVGGASAPLSATLTNSSRFPIQVFSVTTNSAGFAETDTCVGTLGPHRSCAINVVFSPTAAGEQSATLKIGDSTNSTPQGAAQYPHAVALIGTGTSAAQKVTAAPDAISFAPQKAGTTSGSRMVTLSNNQSAVLHIGGVSASSNFVVTTNRCGSSLAASASCTINVAFAPTSHGELTGSLTIANDGTASPITVTLSGAAPMPTPTPTPSPKATPTPRATPTPSPAPAAAALAITPRRLSFGKRAIGANASEAKARYVVLFNPGSQNADAPITIKRVSASGDFAIPANACVGALAPGARCRVPVYFTPRGAGIRRGVLTIESDASNGPQTVRLKGTGLAPAP